MKRRRFYSKLNRTYTLRAGATFALCELSCEKQPLPTTVQIRPEVWTNKLKKRDVPLLDRFRELRDSCVADQSGRIFFIILAPFDDRPDEAEEATFRKPAHTAKK